MEAIEVICRHLLGGCEENYENFQSILMNIFGIKFMHDFITYHSRSICPAHRNLLR
jgi:hypothetical protein